MIIDSEESHQAALFEWAVMAQEKHPELRWLHHIPNGAVLGSDARSRSIRGARIVAQGVKKGVADICLPVSRPGYCGLYIEMKRPSLKPNRDTSSGGLSDEQKEFAQFVIKQGYAWMTAYDWTDAKDFILFYLKKGTS